MPPADTFGLQRPESATLATMPAKHICCVYTLICIVEFNLV